MTQFWRRIACTRVPCAKHVSDARNPSGPRVARVRDAFTHRIKTCPAQRHTLAVTLRQLRGMLQMDMDPATWTLESESVQNLARMLARSVIENTQFKGP